MTSETPIQTQAPTENQTPQIVVEKPKKAKLTAEEKKQRAEKRRLDKLEQAGSVLQEIEEYKKQLEQDLEEQLRKKIEEKLVIQTKKPLEKPLEKSKDGLKVLKKNVRKFKPKAQSKGGLNKPQVIEKKLVEYFEKNLTEPEEVELLESLYYDGKFISTRTQLTTLFSKIVKKKGLSSGLKIKADEELQTLFGLKNSEFSYNVLQTHYKPFLSDLPKELEPKYIDCKE